MLASIHPLGERARDRKWSVTVSAYVLGSTLAATLLGAALGGLGALLPLTPTVTAVAVVALCALALAFDLRLGGLRLPTVHRQVDKDWLDRYRGWVVGLGFGFQLGLGVVTIVTTAAVYLTLALALLTGSPAGGAVVGATFGLVRALVILAVANVRRPDQLRTALRRMQAFRPVFDRLGIAVQALVLITALVRSS
ncbi:MAG TPA: sulfite exporter TauE/SafE family protein [Acidimicrobiales bacterium]|nr:sulfite exporter TauE/SafE family protein [Acidimicrobiales bacterium]